MKSARKKLPAAGVTRVGADKVDIELTRAEDVDKINENPGQVLRFPSHRRG